MECVSFNLYSMSITIFQSVKTFTADGVLCFDFQVISHLSTELIGMLVNIAYRKRETKFYAMMQR